MDVQIVVFPETKVAAIEHFESPEREHNTARKLIAWKVERVHDTDPRTAKPSDHPVDFCLSFEQEMAPNSFGIVNKLIPRNRCALTTRPQSIFTRNGCPEAGKRLAVFRSSSITSTSGQIFGKKR